MSDTPKKEHPIWPALEGLDHALSMAAWQEQQLIQAKKEVEQWKDDLTNALRALTEQELAPLVGRQIDLIRFTVSIDDEDLSISVSPYAPRVSMFDLRYGIPEDDERVEI